MTFGELLHWMTIVVLGLAGTASVIGLGKVLGPELTLAVAITWMCVTLCVLVDTEVSYA